MALGLQGVYGSRLPLMGSQPAAPRPTGPTSIGGLSSDLVYGAQRQGLFDPLGSPILRAMRRREALRNYRNRLRQSGTLGRLLGLDPMAQRQNLLSAQLQGGSDLTDFLNQSQFQEQQGNQDFLRQLLGQERGYEFQKQQADEARRRSKGSFLGSLGGLVGTGLGSLAGGVGAAAGGAAGRKLLGG